MPDINYVIIKYHVFSRNSRNGRELLSKVFTEGIREEVHNELSMKGSTHSAENKEGRLHGESKQWYGRKADLRNEHH